MIQEERRSRHDDVAAALKVTWYVQLRAWARWVARGKACWPRIDWENIRVDGTSSARLSERALDNAGHTSHNTRNELHYTSEPASSPPS